MKPPSKEEYMRFRASARERYWTPDHLAEVAGKAIVLIVCAAIALAAGAFFLVGCDPPRTSVLAGAQTALEAICEHVPSAHLDMARQLLGRGDLQGAAEYLRSELAQNGYQRDVSALLALLESQMPVVLP